MQYGLNYHVSHNEINTKTLFLREQFLIFYSV